jgi:hypothetical protein
MKKEFVLLLTLLFGGLYVISFGVFTLSIVHMFWNGVVLIGFGTLVTTFCMVVFVDYKSSNMK